MLEGIFVVFFANEKHFWCLSFYVKVALVNYTGKKKDEKGVKGDQVSTNLTFDFPHQLRIIHSL